MTVSQYSIINDASNFKRDKNPPFSLEDFYLFYPQFETLVGINEIVADSYLQFANDCVNIKRWGNQWRLGMCLFIAHFLTLYLQSFTIPGSAANEVMAAAQTKGLISSKSVGDVSVSYDFSVAVDGLENWGQWKTTSFGLQYASLAKMLGKGNVMIW